MTQSLAGKNAIVTGAGRGIGAAAAEALVTAGARVVIVSRTEEELLKTKTRIESKYGAGRVFHVKADVSREEEVKHVFHFVLGAVGVPHILINNAAIVLVKKFSEMS